MVKRGLGSAVLRGARLSVLLYSIFGEGPLVTSLVNCKARDDETMKLVLISGLMPCKSGDSLPSFSKTEKYSLLKSSNAQAVPKFLSDATCHLKER